MSRSVLRPATRDTRPATSLPGLYRLAPRARRWEFWQLVRLATWLNLAAVLVVLVLICLVSETWWVSALLTYLPRSVYAIPAAGLLGLSLLMTRDVAWVNALSLLLVVAPVMGLSFPLSTPPQPLPGQPTFRIVSGNVQEGLGDIHRVIEEIESFQPDLIALQETARLEAPLAKAFADWQRVHLREFFIASRYPLRVVDHCRPQAFDRWSTLLVEIDVPGGPIRLSDTHLATPRHGATGLTPFSFLTGDGVEEFIFHQRLRDEEAAATREFLDRWTDRPLLVMGDFNTPTTSSLFAEHWHGFQSAFEQAGRGYGYTAPCNTHRFWPANTPWVRIDHILTDHRWVVHECRIGQRDGSDHRLVFAEVSLLRHPSLPE